MFVVNGVCNNKSGNDSTRIMILLSSLLLELELPFRSYDKIECNAKD